jgi:hypothetical protein
MSGQTKGTLLLSYRKQHSGKPPNDQVKVEANREPVNHRHQVSKPPRKVTTIVSTIILPGRY